MSDLVAFVTARLDEREAVAKAYVPVGGITHRHSEGAGWREHNHVAGGVPHQHDPDTGFQIPVATVDDSARVLREIDANRAILAMWQEPGTEKRLPTGEVVAQVAVADAINEVIWRLATADSDHPDFDPEWDPDF